METLAMVGIGVLLLWGVWELSGMLFRSNGSGVRRSGGFTT